MPYGGSVAPGPSFTSGSANPNPFPGNGVANVTATALGANNTNARGAVPGVPGGLPTQAPAQPEVFTGAAVTLDSAGAMFWVVVAVALCLW